MLMEKRDQQAMQNQYRDLSYTEQGRNGDVNAFVGHGVEFKGRIIYHGTVRIDGTMEGEIQTEGCLLVGDGAVLTAKVRAGVVICKGTITGDIVADEKVQLLSPAVLNGSVATPLLSMEEGVMFNGKVDMTAGGTVAVAPLQNGVAHAQRRSGAEYAHAGQKAGARQGQGDGNQFVGTPES